MRSTVIGLLVALAVPAAASARGRTVPPGNSSVMQYVESIPTAKGNRPTTTITPGGGGGGSSGANGAAGGAGVLTASQQRALARQGRGGLQVAALAAATGSGRARHRSHGGAGVTTVAKPTPQVFTPGGSAPASDVVNALTGGSTHGGLGPLLPVILIVGALGPGLIVLSRRRRRTD
jgi:hypothetical protein